MSASGDSRRLACSRAVVCAGAVLMALCAASCGKGDGTGGDRGKEPSRNAPAGSAPRAADPASAPRFEAVNARVLVDTSLSVQGFTKSRPIVLDTIHRNLMEALSGVGLTDVDYCEVGNTDVPVCSLKADPLKYSKERTYDAVQSHVALVLAPVRKDAPLTEQGAPRVSPVDEKGLSVLITDGLEASEGSPEASHVEGECVPGTDVYCLQRILVNRAAEGYGIWVVAVSLPFKGRVFAERPLDKAMFETTTRHVTDLRSTGEWTSVPLEVKGLKRNPKTGNDNFEYTGARPLLLVVLSRDLAKGRRLVASITDRLSATDIVVPAGRIRAMEVAPHETGVFVFDRVGLSGGPPQVDLERRVRLLGNPVRQRGQGLSLTAECGIQGTGQVSVTTRQARSPSSERPVNLRPTVAVKPEHQLPGNAVEAPRASEGGYSIAFNCLNLPTDEASAAFRLETGMAYTGALRSGWWWEWSAENTYETPERIFRLGELIEGVLAVCQKAPALQDRLIINLRKKR